jgi:predicted site-specific integrase-resolvase
MKEQECELDKKYLTQQEVADLFRVRPGTIKNWRDAGYLDYFQVPGSSRVLYPTETINQFERQHIKRAKIIQFHRPDAVKNEEGQGLSSNRTKKEWRI